MVQSEHATAVLIDFDETSGILRLRSIGKSPFSRFDLKRTIRVSDLHAECTSYWVFVDNSIKSGQLTQRGTDGLEMFYDELKTKGNRLCKFLLEGDARKQLWGLARQSTVITIITELMFVPWEALFDHESQSFLSDNCVIVRWPEISGDSDRVPIESSFNRDRIVFLDPILAADSKLLVDGVQIKQFLSAHFGNDLQLTTIKSALVDTVRSTRLVQWICEHASEGLRLNDAVFYTQDDSQAHPFPSGAILILTSCKSAGSNVPTTSVAASICGASQCTVIAPSSVVATSIGVKFAHNLDQELRSNDRKLTVIQLWRRMLVTNEDIKRDASKLTAQSCFARWYGIYGNGQAVLN